MKYQLRRMVLVNVGTNVRMTSARFTSIDPRGGAAVLGDNGVGKTTTLRLIPLFFGHLSSQIVSSGQGQVPMIRFVLPTDASAIAFEYQRGSGDDDIRLAVIRRRSDDHDVPVYRLYKSAFRRDLFLDGEFFLSDDQTQQRATALGIQTTSKLSTSEYRSVILRTPGMSRDKDRLRRYSLEWSFGPRQLNNLDRLVAAMVKKHINFADIVQVAVGLVQVDLGQGSDRAKLLFKQGPGPIAHWIRNRNGCVDAFKLAPQIAELEDYLKAHRAAESLFRARRADVDALRSARVAERSELSTAVDQMCADREAALSLQAVERVALAQEVVESNAVAATSKGEYDEQDGLCTYFVAHRAAHWESRVQDLPSLRLAKKSLAEQVAAAESAHEVATAKYARMEQEACTSTMELKLALELDKQPHRDRLAQALEQIAQAEAAAKTEAAGSQAERKHGLDEALEPLVEARGTWDARKATPTSSDAVLREIEQATEKLQAHTESRGSVQQVLSRAMATEMAARRAFSDHEQAIRAARADFEAAGAATEAARQLLTPKPGTLLAVLREHSDDTWKRTLAKVINPALLERADLDPTVVEDVAQAVYGWQLSTGVIASPDWVDDGLARKALEVAESRAAAAEAHLRGVQDGLVGQSRALKDAEQAVGIAQARLGVLDSQTDALKAKLATAKLTAATEKRSSLVLADAEICRLNGEVDMIRSQLRHLQRETEQQQLAIKAAHDDQRARAKRSHDESIAVIDGGILRLDGQLRSTLDGLAAQLTEHLSEAGVDVARLLDLRERESSVSKELGEREEREPLVARWRAWMLAGGVVRVETLRQKAARAAEASRLLVAKLSEFDARVAGASNEYNHELAIKSNRLKDVDVDLRILADLDLEFEDYQATGESVIDPKTTARELQGRVQVDRSALTKAYGTVVKRAESIRQKLTGTDSAVKDLVDASLLRVAEHGDISRAAELCTCYKLIGPQIANDVNITLKTLLANIGAFQKAILTFEREVAAFNRRLQEGLNEVRCFERIKDLRLDIVTNFENLGFYKKLARLEDIVRQHAHEFGRDYTQELPSDETARALEDFVGVLGSDGSVEVTLSSHITLSGSVTANGQRKEFKRSSDLENIDSEGITGLILITLMTALLNVIRGSDPVHVPWVTDEIGRFDPKNMVALMRMLSDNRIDVVTASPELGPAQQAMFAQRYVFEDRGVIHEYTSNEGFGLGGLVS